jgi:endonuclease G
LLDPQLALEQQVNNDAYAHNDWDRGNLISRIDATWNMNFHNQVYMYSLTVPQHKYLNRTLWFELEKFSRNLVREKVLEEVIVVSGPIYGEETIENYKGVVDIPDKFFRFLINTRNSKVLSWIVPNNETAKDFERINGLPDFLTTVDEIERQSKLDFFTSFSEQQQEFESRLVSIKEFLE